MKLSKQMNENTLALCIAGAEREIEESINELYNFGAINRPDDAETLPDGRPVFFVSLKALLRARTTRMSMRLGGAERIETPAFLALCAKRAQAEIDAIPEERGLVHRTLTGGLGEYARGAVSGMAHASHDCD